MNYGGDAADQIVRYSLDGVDHGLRLSGTLAKHLAVFVAAVLKDQKKTRGKTRMATLANMTLDGIEKLLAENFPIHWPNKTTYYPKIHLIRYADDFIIP